jgi:threonine dehydrogenase-like Zn-dependent dehydrogenase
MLAAVLAGPDHLELREVPTPSAGPGEVLVEVGANTICGTDLRIIHGEKTSGVRLPVVLGHELAGHVAEVGRGVRGYEVGAPVAMAPVIPCRRCWQCRHDLENLCVNQRIVGYEVAGGLAEHCWSQPRGSRQAACSSPAATCRPSGSPSPRRWRAPSMASAGRRSGSTTPCWSWARGRSACCTSSSPWSAGRAR